jgi:hypothetical protein
MSALGASAPDAHPIRAACPDCQIRLGLPPGFALGGGLLTVYVTTHLGWHIEARGLGVGRRANDATAHPVQPKKQVPQSAHGPDARR